MNSGINYNIIRRKVKNIRISVNREKEVKVVIPMKYPVSELEKVLDKRIGWIKKKIDHFENLKNSFFKLGENEILYLNEKYVFELIPELKNKVRVDYEDRKIYSGLNLLNKKIQTAWLKLEARRIIEERIKLINGDGLYKYQKIYIRNQKTKWGNCSGRKNISFNWRLVKAPLNVIDYLIAHEFTHLDEMNHSKMFWYKLSLVCPDYHQPNRWLKKNGAGLFY
jgi:predicted metal-dependent hydrolase